MTERTGDQNLGPVTLHGMQHVAVVGMMGAGKTSFAVRLAAALGRPYFDSDDVIEERFGCVGGVLAAERGVDELHSIEAGLVFEHLTSGEPCVFSVAASVVENADCFLALRDRATTVWVDTPIDVLVGRMATGDHRRLMSEAELVERFEQRCPLFGRVAAVRVDGLATADQQVATFLAFLQS